MPEKVTISHRGSRYEIGRGRRYYGIWVTDGPDSDPVDRWPETPDGWTQAWSRFVAMEAPGAIVPVERGGGFRLPRFRFSRPGGSDSGKEPAGTIARVAAALLALGVVAGIAGLFPDYNGASLASQSDQLVPHLLYLAGWAVSAALVAYGARRGQADGAGSKIRAGALIGTGVSAVTLGLLLADLAQATSTSAVGAGMVLGLVGWAACAAGSLGGLSVPAKASGGSGRPARPGRENAGPIALLVLGALGTAAAFAPSWDSYTLRSAAGAETITVGNAFSNPGTVMAADVLVMVAIVAVAFAAALWRPARQGAALLAGAIVPLAAQAISALIQVGQPASPYVFSYFGLPPAQAEAAGLTVASGLTPVFWVYCVFVFSLAISSAWLLTGPGVPTASGPVQNSTPPAAKAPGALRRECDLKFGIDLRYI